MTSNRENQEERLLALMRRQLDLPLEARTSEITRQNFPEWDSLRHVRLLLEVQREFGIRFSTSEIVKISSFEDIRLLVAGK